MATDGIKITGMTEYQDELGKIEKNFPDAIIDVIDKNSRKLRKDYRAKTHNVTGALDRGMKLVPAERTRGDFEGGVKSTAPHFHLHEYGHDIVVGGKKGKGGKVVGRVKGRFALKRSFRELKPKLEKDIEKMIKKEMKGLQ